MIAALIVVAATQAPFLRAELAPPPGGVFLGTFHWLDDVQNYLSFAQQAEAGASLFINKLYPYPQTPAMLSPEFWLVGRASAWIFGDLFLAFRVLGLVATLIFVAAMDRILAMGGLPRSHRLPALLLVCGGGGFGGLMFRLTDWDVSRCLDLSSGLFPFMAFLANPHWAAASALLLCSLLLLLGDTRRSLALAVVLVNLLAFSRPYEPVLLLGMAAVVSVAEPRFRRRALILAAGLAPWAAYQAWLSLAAPAFAFLARLRYPPFAFPDLIPALGPALALALFSLARPQIENGRAMRRALWAWSALALLAALGRQPGSQNQLLVGVGAPLLALGSIGLARFKPRVTWITAGLLGISAAVSVQIAWGQDAPWYVPREQMTAVEILKKACLKGDVAFAPPSVGLTINALTSCQAYAAHEAGFDYRSRLREIAAFYQPMNPARRRGLLDDACVAHLLLPGAPAPKPADWLGPETDFHWVASSGQGPSLINVYSRPAPPCSPGPAPDGA